MKNVGVDEKVVNAEENEGGENYSERVGVDLVQKDLKEIVHLYVEMGDKEPHNTAELVLEESMKALWGQLG